MNILYLSYDGMTDPLGQSQVIPYLRGLSKKGHHITIISFEKAKKKEDKSHIAQILNSSGIQWKPLDYTKRPPVLSTLYDIYRLNKTVKKLIGEINDPKNTVLHCRSYITSLIGLGFKKKRKVKFIFDMRGFWADERVEGNIWNLKNPLFKFIYKYFKKKELQFFKEANHTISLTHKGAEEIKNMYGAENIAPITIIPCCVDNDHFDSAHYSVNDNALIRRSLNIKESNFVLGYVGSIGTWYMLPEMITFFKELLSKKPESIFLFVSKESPEYIHEEAIKQGIPLDKIRIISATRTEVPDYINAFDWSIFFIKPVFSKQASSPTKQGEIMSMGIPIVCNDRVGDTEKIINKYGAGIVIHNFDKESYQSAITDLSIFKNHSSQIRHGSIDFFSLDKGLESYASVYENL